MDYKTPTKRPTPSEIAKGFKTRNEEGLSGVERLTKEREEREKQEAEQAKKEKYYKLDKDISREPTYEEMKEAGPMERQEGESKDDWRKRQIDSAAKNKSFKKETIKSLPSTPPGLKKSKKKEEAEDLW